MTLNREPDVEALITALTTDQGGRKTPIFDGYSPQHQVHEGYLSSGQHHYYGKETLLLGETTLGTITFLAPEAYLHCLWVGKVIGVYEGSHLVGHARITKIFNKVLQAENKE